MKKIILITSLVFAVSAFALDAVKNDFWDTTAYKNPVTASAASSVLDAEISSPEPMATKSYFSNVVQIFSTIKSCFSLIFR